MTREELIHELYKMSYVNKASDELSDFILSRERNMREEIICELGRDSGFWGRTCSRHMEKNKALMKENEDLKSNNRFLLDKIGKVLRKIKGKYLADSPDISRETAVNHNNRLARAIDKAPAISSKQVQILPAVKDLMVGVPSVAKYDVQVYKVGTSNLLLSPLHRVDDEDGERQLHTSDQHTHD